MSSSAALRLISFFCCCFFVTALCPIPFVCNNTFVEDSEVEHYCKNVIAGTMEGRCCVSNETILGLNLRFCGVKVLNLTITTFGRLVIMDLQDNDMDKFTKEEFFGLENLSKLFLPLDYPCPGGDDAWNQTIKDNNRTECSNQLDPCYYKNISCTVNGMCKHIGPGSMTCGCKPGHRGYKCLTYGYFPTTAFSVAIVIPTIVLSIVFWFVIGREPYRNV